MRGSDEGPERPVRRRASGRLLVVLVVAASAVVVLSTAVGGPVRFTSPFGSNDPGLSPVNSPPAPPAASAAPRAAPSPPVAGGIVQTVLEVLVGAVALVVAILLIRLLVAALLARRRRSGPRRPIGIDAEAEPALADAPAVLRGIAAALAVFDERREPGDAVVRAWLGLQQAAEDAGVTRAPAETPTEFTGRVLSRTGTDRTALRTLLRLYLRARFDDGAITDVDAEAARAALRALEASWERVTA